MQTVASLGIDFTTNVAQIANDMTKVRSTVTKTLEGIKTVAATAFATFIPAELIHQSLGMAGAMHDLSAQTDIATESLQKYKIIAGENGVAGDKFGEAITKLTGNIGKAREGSTEMIASFARVGISWHDLATQTPEAIFNKMQDGFARMKTQADRSAAATTIFGKAAGPGMAVFMAQGSEAIRRQGELLQSVGAIMSGDLVQAASDANDALGTLTDTMQVAFNAGFLSQIQTQFHLISESMTGSIAVSRDLGEIFGFVSSQVMETVGDIVKLVNTLGHWVGGMEMVKTVTLLSVDAIKLGFLGVQDILVTSAGAIFKVFEKLDQARVSLARAAHIDATPVQFLKDMADGSAFASKDITAHMERIKGDMDTANSKFHQFMQGGQTQELANQLDILNSGLQTTKDKATNLVNVPLPTHIKAAATAARTAKTDMDRLGESVGNMFQDITRDALNGTLSLKSFGDYAARLVGELFKSESFQNGASSIFSSITSDIGSVFSGIFGGGRASGGGVDAGKTYLVGEEGPELLRMGASSGSIVPNHALGGGVNVTTNIYNNSGAQVSTKARRTSGGVQLDVMIDDIMAGKASDGGSAFARRTGSAPLIRR